MNYPDGMQFEHISGDGDQYAENRRRMAEEGVRDEYAVAISYARWIASVAGAVENMDCKIPANELYRPDKPETWTDIAARLRDVIEAMGATDKQLDELADVRITGEGYA